MKTRRVGAITCGIILIITGILCLIHIFYPPLSYEYILKGWPVILISLGGEMLAANLAGNEDVKIKYDTGAVILMFILVIFAVCMGALEYITYIDKNLSI